MAFTGKSRSRFRVRTAILVFAVFAFAAAVIRRWIVPLALPVESVPPEDATGLIEHARKNPDFVILDVRTPPEFARKRLAVALNVSARSKTFRDEITKLDKEKVYFVYSERGGRSWIAAALMKKLGFKNVFHLAGGIDGWECAGLPVVR